MSSFIAKKLDIMRTTPFHDLVAQGKARGPDAYVSRNERVRVNHGRSRCPNGAVGLVMPIRKASMAMP